MSPAFDLIAGHSGTCPICGRYIVSERSRISALPCAFPPNPAVTHYGREGWSVDNAPGHVRGRRWAHADCRRRLDAKYADAEQLALSADWRTTLDALKRRVDRERLHRYGRRKAAATA